MFVALAAMLYVLAFAMIGGGGYLAAEGSQILAIERGVAYYIGGLGLSTGGLVVFGIATLVLCLGSVQRAIKQVQAASVPMQPQFAPFAEPAPIMVAAAEPAQLAEEPAPLQSERAEIPVETADPENSAYEPIVVPAQASEPEVEPACAQPDNSRERPMPVDVGIKKSAFGYYSSLATDAPAQKLEPVEIAPLEVVDVPEVVDVYESEPEVIPAETPVDEPEVLAATAAREEPPAFVEPAAVAPAPPAVTIVGSYESGGNRYVMYSDGSIDAHLPTGVRTFLSLDELKQFVSTSSPA